MKETPMRRYLRFRNQDRDPTLDMNTSRKPEKVKKVKSVKLTPKAHYHK